jgi:hypothetical protein
MVRYILIVGIIFIAAGLFGAYDFFFLRAGEVDPQIGLTQFFRLLTGGVFVVGSMALERLTNDRSE